MNQLAEIVSPKSGKIAFGKSYLEEAHTSNATVLQRKSSIDKGCCKPKTKYIGDKIIPATSHIQYLLIQAIR